LLRFETGGSGFCGGRLAEFPGDALAIGSGLAGEVEDGTNGREFELGDTLGFHFGSAHLKESGRQNAKCAGVDSFMTLQPGEQFLRRERVHRGIFAIPALILFACLLLDVPWVLILVQMAKVLAPLGQANSRGLFLPWLMAGALAVLPALAIFIIALIAFLKCEIALTTKRLIYRTGFFSRAAGELPLENIDAIFILEPMLGRLLGYGTVTACSLGGLQFPLSFIGKPQILHAALQKAVTGAKTANRVLPKAPPVIEDDSRYMPKG
jgi:hypothetical protein